ncbi:MAG: DUF2993 domain-containing protein [Mycobacteriaceae bacterium]|nr:DUF2993 domain-containing protein [Mycobacteriaceae bacterium]
MRRVIVGLAFLVGLAVLVDFSAAAYAEYRVSRAVRAGADLNADPAVTIHGFPFLAQVGRDNYRDIEIRAREMRPDIVGGMYVVAHLRDVQMPLSKLLDGSVRTVTAGGVDASIFIDPTALGHLLGISDLQVSTPPADKSDGSGGSGGSGMTTAGPIVLMGTVPISGGTAGDVPVAQTDGAAGTTQRVSVQARLVLENGRIRIVADQLYVGRLGRPDTPVPDADLPGVLARFSKVIDFPPLPFGLAPTTVGAHGGQIILSGAGKRLTLKLDQLQHP